MAPRFINSAQDLVHDFRILILHELAGAAELIRQVHELLVILVNVCVILVRWVCP